MRTNDGAMDALFAPRSIAIIGASGDAQKIGGRPVSYLLRAGYEGAIYPINPTHERIQGLPAYARLMDVPGEVDLTVVAVPAARVPEAVTDCARKGVKAAIIFSAGFAESDAAGELIQDEVLAIAKQGGVRLLGPNCMGTINTACNSIATFTSGIVGTMPAKGNISIASQSGALGAHCLVLAGQKGLGLRFWVTAGNQIDLEISDFLLHMAQDPETHVILASIEGVRDGDKLVQALKEARARGKPVIIMKLGRSQVGAAAAASHTASLGGEDAIFDAVLRQHGAFRAQTLDELFDLAYTFSKGHAVTSEAIGLVTVSGGAGIIMADAAEEYGLDVPPLPPATRKKLKEQISFAGTRNPVDVTAQILNQTELLYPMFETLASSDRYGCIITFLAHLGCNPEMIARLTPDLKRIADDFGQKHALILAMISTEEVRARLEEIGFLVFEDPARAVRAAAALVRWSRLTRAGHNAPEATAPVTAARPLPIERGRIYSEHASKRLLANSGIRFAQEALATSADQAVREAERIGYPVVLKIVSQDIPHKSEIGGVLVGLDKPETVRQGYETLLARAKQAAPHARLDGVLVAQMIRDGTEMILGTTDDPAFGPVVMLGFGGIFTEVLNDVTFRPAPFDVAEAQTMIDELRGVALLRGARGRQTADHAALARALADLSAFADANRDNVQTIDINPLIVLPQGEGAIALDALLEAKPPQ